MILRRYGRHILGILLVVLAALAWFFFRPLPLAPVQASASLPQGAALIARGKYLTDAADCAACHTLPGGKPFAGGLPFRLPFGTIYATNITSDPKHGIGGWSDAEFVRALREGVGRHGENLYPAFPYTSYALVSTDDAIAIHAYLKTIAPVAADAPANSLIFPFNQRRIMRGWNLLFLSKGEFSPTQDKSAAWNRGAYLVEGLGHCSECHSPRNLLFARKQGKALSGGDVEGWKAWNITPDKETGIGWWTDAELAQYLSQGHAPRHGAATGKMREAIEISLSRLKPDDISAIVTYLRSVPAREGDDAARVALSTPAMQRSRAWSSGNNDPSLGRRIFEGACASCHGWSGSGRQTARAALAGARAVNAPEGANLVRVILEGSKSEHFDPASAMPAFGHAYSDAEIAAVANYVIGHFGGKTGTVSIETVRQARQK